MTDPFIDTVEKQSEDLDIFLLYPLASKHWHCIFSISPSIDDYLQLMLIDLTCICVSLLYST
jgi:hypothetical protein